MDSVDQNTRDDDAHRRDRVEAVWSAAPPSELGNQWSLYPLSHPVIKAAMNRRATGNPNYDTYVRLSMQLTDWGFELPISRAASLCCGTGALERGLVADDIVSRCTGFDLAEGALQAARHAAALKGYSGLSYEYRDLERDGLGLSGIQVVFAHEGVHHISRLEPVFDAVNDALVPGGVFHLHEFVRPDQFQWTDRQIEEMNAWLQSLPQKYQMTMSGAIKTCTGRATIAEMNAYDPSEAIRSSAIEPLLAERFDIVERKALGGTLTQMALAEIGHNFNPQNAEDVTHLTRLLRREDELMATGEIGSDFAVIVARKRTRKRSSSARSRKR